MISDKFNSPGSARDEGGRVPENFDESSRSAGFELCQRKGVD
jgi:hypothetical protein